MIDMMNNGQSWGMGSGMWALSILFWVLVIAGVFLVARGLLGQKSEPGTAPSGDSPLTILQARYARGDIDEDTYMRMKQELEEQGS